MESTEGWKNIPQGLEQSTQCKVYSSFQVLLNTVLMNQTYSCEKFVCPLPFRILMSSWAKETFKFYILI